MLRRILPGISNAGFLRKASTYSACEGLILEPRNQVLWIKLNRPDKFNAITYDMYVRMTEALENVNNDKSVKSVVVTGIGDYYSSGNDLNNLLVAMKHQDGPRAGLTDATRVLERFVASFINVERLLIAAVNGPAIGIPVTTLPLFDYVIASDKATFQSPFTALGQCPEACSSYTFPSIMGRSRSSEMLLLNRSWSATKAQGYGLVSDVTTHDKFSETVEELLYGKHGIIKKCYPYSTIISQSLIKDKATKDRLHEVNKRECEAILELWLGAECMDALQRFMSKSK